MDEEERGAVGISPFPCVQSDPSPASDLVGRDRSGAPDRLFRVNETGLHLVPPRVVPVDFHLLMTVWGRHRRDFRGTTHFRKSRVTDYT